MGKSKAKPGGKRNRKKPPKSENGAMGSEDLDDSKVVFSSSSFERGKGGKVESTEVERRNGLADLEVVEKPRAPPRGIERSKLHQRCEAWMVRVWSNSDVDARAEDFCQYGGFLSSEKRRLAELHEHQLRRSKIIASLYGTAMRANNTSSQAKMSQLQKEHEDNARAFEVTKLEAEVLNYHQDLFRSEKLYAQLKEVGARMAVQVGEKEFVMKPELDLPPVSFESVLEEEKAREKEYRESLDRNDSECSADVSSSIQPDS